MARLAAPQASFWKTTLAKQSLCGPIERPAIIAMREQVAPQLGLQAAGPGAFGAMLGQMPYDAGPQPNIPTPRPMMPRPQGMSA